MFLAENRGFQFAGTHCKMPLPLICMSLSHSLALGVLLRFFPPLWSTPEKKGAQKTMIIATQLSPATS